jgi:hypothetical protein
MDDEEEDEQDGGIVPAPQVAFNFDPQMVMFNALLSVFSCELLVRTFGSCTSELTSREHCMR